MGQWYSECKSMSGGNQKTESVIRNLSDLSENVGYLRVTGIKVDTLN